MPLSISSCSGGSPPPPSWFYPDLRATTNFWSGSYPWMVTYANYGFDPGYMSLIACYESAYQLGAQNGQYYGMWQMNTYDMSIYIGGSGAFTCYMYGCYGIANWAWQDYTAMRYIHDRYGSPGAAWNHEVQYGWY